MWQKLQSFLVSIFFPHWGGVSEAVLRTTRESNELLVEMDALNKELRSKLTILEYELRIVKEK